ncbi:MAG: asparagine synthase (glutamine-hydrolyzing) [Sphingomonadaceae bacterium]
MCGISGVFAASGAPVALGDVVTMNARIAHRGPDGDGIWVADDGACILGHRRLAIIDVDQRADQPMLSHDGESVIVFNGEIYNFLELRDELATKGHVFRTESDTEVIHAAWRAWGVDMLPRFNGMWAFAIYSRAKRELFLARDRFGVKPLLYAHESDRFAFASEMRALLALPWVGNAIDADVMSRQVFDPFSVEASERSLYKDIRKVPAGHWMCVGPGGTVQRRWWRTTDNLVDPPATLAAAADGFGARFHAAVKVRMRSDVPIGSCLSGGFDSSAVVAMMAHIADQAGVSHERENSDWRHAFVASFPGMSNDETEDAKVAATYAGIPAPRIADFSQDSPLEHLDAVLETLEEPFIGLPTAVWKIYREVDASGIRVSIDGHGADEMMGGYRQGNRSLMFRLQTQFGNAAGRHPMFGRISDQLKLTMLRRNGLIFLRKRLVPPQPLAITANDDALPKEWGALNRRLYGMFHGSVLPTLLRNFDRLSMAHSVEVRSPFLDWQLATFVLSLPDAMKSNSEYSKLVAREAMRGRMPEQIRAAKRKFGFGSQMPEWLNGGLGQWAANLLDRPHPFFDEIVDRPALCARVAAMNAAQRWSWDSAARIWPYVHFRWMLDRQ